MVNRRKFNRIKEKNPESRIRQRTWEQEKYRNRLCKILKRYRKKGDVTRIVAEKTLKQQQSTREYISAKYGTTQESAKKMIEDGYGELVANHFNEFVGLDKSFAMSVLKNFYGCTYIKRPSFYKTGYDSSYDLCVGNKLCELIVKNANKISGLDKEFVDGYINFYNRYKDYDIDYGPSDTLVRYNSLTLLVENMKFIEGVDGKYLSDYLVGHFHENKERDKKLCGLSKSLLENTEIKFPGSVFDFLKDLSGYPYWGWLCSYLERFEFDKLPKDFILSCFRASISGHLEDYTEERFLDLVKYIQNYPELGITIDDLFKYLYEQDMEYDGKYHVIAAERLVKILPHISVSKEDILKVFKLIVTHIPRGYADTGRRRKSLLDSLSKFESYIINHPELNISSIELYYTSMGWDLTGKYEYKPYYDDTIAGFKSPNRYQNHPDSPWYFNNIFKKLISIEKIRAEEEKKIG